MKKIFSLDGGKTWREFSSLRIECKVTEIPGEDGGGELFFNFTHEGLITDVWVGNDQPWASNIGTSSETYDEIVSRLVEDNS